MYRFDPDGSPQLLLVHPGGPFFRGKETGAWSVPKGLIDEGEQPLDAARREFKEETGYDADGPFIELGEIRQKGGKLVQCWACEGSIDPDRIRSSTFEREWPPRSGRMQTFPEVDRAGYFDIDTARRKINPAQVELIDRLLRRLKGRPSWAQPQP